jgi:hypothetical protein
MKEGYHKKIETLQKEIEKLKEYMKPESHNQPINEKNKSNCSFKITELENQLREYRKKEKNQSLLAKQLESQKLKMNSLDEEIKKIKVQKLNLLKKLKEENEK